MWNAKFKCSLVISACSSLPQYVLDYNTSHVLGVLPVLTIHMTLIFQGWSWFYFPLVTLKFSGALMEEYLEHSFVVPVVYMLNLFPSVLCVCTYINVYLCVLYHVHI